MLKQSKKQTGKLTALLLAIIMVFALTPLMSFAGTVAATVDNDADAKSAAISEIMDQAKAASRVEPADGQEAVQKGIQRGYGEYDDGAGIFCTTHTNGSTYSYTVGRQIFVEADCYDYNGYGYYSAFFGVWDKTKEEYTDEFYVTDYIYDTMETWNAKIDTSSLVVSSGRYEVDVVLWDELYDYAEAWDTFKLTVKAIGTPVIGSAVPAGAHSATISWNAVPATSGYKVYRATSSTGTYTYLGATKSTTYTASGMTTGKRYYFKVKAYNTDGAKARYSALSSYRSVVPMPTKPAGFAVGSWTYESVRASWEPVSGATGYQLYMATSSSGTYTYVGKTSKTAKLVTGLVTGKTYYFKVRAYHTESSGKNYYSSYSTVKTVKPVPSTPVVGTELVTKNSVSVTWNQITGAHGYEVFRYDAVSGGYALVKTITSGATTSYLDTGLQLDMTYRYKVRAYHTENGAKIYSVLQSAGVAETTLGTPALVVDPIGSGTINVYWTEVLAANGYNIYRFDESQPEAGWVLLATEDSSATMLTYQDMTCVPGTYYQYKIQAYKIENLNTVYGDFYISESIAAL